MPAYSTDWIKRLNQLRETNPEAVRQIEERADAIYEGYDWDEAARKDGLTSRARAMEQAWQEYQRMAGATGTQAIADLPEEDPLAGLPERDPEPEPSLETEIVPEEERDQYPTEFAPDIGRYRDIYRQRPAPKRSTVPIAEDTTEDQPDDVELTPFSMSDIEDLEDPTLLQRLGRFAKSDQGLSVLQALAKGGQAYMGSRAQSEANQRTRQSQARANLINALSSRAGARGTTEQPRMGKLGTLFGTLADIGGGVREERTAERKRERERDAFEALRDYRQESLDVQRAGQEITLGRQEQAVADRKTRKRLEADKVTADGLKSMISDTVGMGQHRSIDEFFASNPDAKSKFDNLSEPYQGLVLSGFTQGLKDFHKDALKRLKGADSAQVESAVKVLRGVWDDIDYQGGFEGFTKEMIRRALPELAAGYVQPAETTYMAERAGLSLPIASAFNDGRPSNADAEAVLRMLPKVGEAKPVVDRKWKALDELIQLKREVENRGLKLAPDQQDFLTLGVLVPSSDGGYVVDKEKAFEVLNQYATQAGDETGEEVELVYDAELSPQQEPE